MEHPIFRFRQSPIFGRGDMSMGLCLLRSLRRPRDWSNVAQQPEYGLYGMMTPGEIAEARRADPTPTLDEEKGDSPLQQSLRQAETRTPERETRDKDMER